VVLDIVDERTLKEARIVSTKGRPGTGAIDVEMSGTLDGMPSRATMSFSAAASSQVEVLVRGVERSGEVTLTGSPTTDRDGRPSGFLAQRAEADGLAAFADMGVLTRQPARALDGPDGPRAIGSRADEAQPSVLARIREGSMDL
jgi:hypothetical protein